MTQYSKRIVQLLARLLQRIKRLIRLPKRIIHRHVAHLPARTPHVLTRLVEQRNHRFELKLPISLLLRPRLFRLRLDERLGIGDVLGSQIPRRHRFALHPRYRPKIVLKRYRIALRTRPRDLLR